jgi:hypothetical protein
LIKGKLGQKKLFKNIDLKSFSANSYSNIIIIILSVIIIYLSYSIYSKFRVKNINEFENLKPSIQLIQVEVLNGCGFSGKADKITDFLRQHHFDVVQIGNYISYDVEKSIVIDRTGNMINAFKVADSLGISHKNVIQQMSSKYFLDVSLVIGKDYSSLKPYQ